MMNYSNKSQLFTFTCQYKIQGQSSVYNLDKVNVNLSFIEAYSGSLAQTVIPFTLIYWYGFSTGYDAFEMLKGDIAIYQDKAYQIVEAQTTYDPVTNSKLFIRLQGVPS